LVTQKRDVSYQELINFLDAFIMEEYEKAERTVPRWKIDWVKEIIRDGKIIIREDNRVALTTEGVKSI